MADSPPPRRHRAHAVVAEAAGLRPHPCVHAPATGVKLVKLKKSPFQFSHMHAGRWPRAAWHIVVVGVA